MSIKHKKQVFAEDGTDPNAVHPSDWNDEHLLDGFLALFADLGVGPDQFPYIKTDGTGALAPVTAPARNFLAQVTTKLMLAAIGAAGLDSPAFINTPTAPTPALGLNTDQIATMAALKAMRDDLVHAAPGTLDTLKELADAIGDDPNFAATMTAALGNRLRFDAAQSLTTGQKAQAIANLALAAVAVSGAYADLTGRPTLGTAAALNVGTAANQVVQLDGSAKLPAVDGSQLVNLGGLVKRVKQQLFSASGTYTPSAGLLFAVIECVAAGGGGGGTSANGGTYLGGGGGEGGGYAHLIASAATIGASQSVTIGAGGTAGSSAGGDGGGGGDTSLGSLCIAKGGAAGAGTTNAATTGGAGGVGSGNGTGDYWMRGQPGQAGMFFVPGAGSWQGLGSDGGNSARLFGAGGRVAKTPDGSSSAGSGGRGYGGGGSGAINCSSASGNAGGAGAPGVVIITEFCSQ